MVFLSPLPQKENPPDLNSSLGHTFFLCWDLCFLKNPSYIEILNIWCIIFTPKAAKLDHWSTFTDLPQSISSSISVLLRLLYSARMGFLSILQLFHFLKIWFLLNRILLHPYPHLKSLMNLLIRYNVFVYYRFKNKLMFLYLLSWFLSDYELGFGEYRIGQKYNLIYNKGSGLDYSSYEVLTSVQTSLILRF